MLMQILRIAIPFIAMILVAVVAISVTTDPLGRAFIMALVAPLLIRLAWRLIVSPP